MIVESVVFGLFSLIFYSLTTYLTWRTIKNIKRNEKYALARFYTEPKVIKAYFILSFTSLLFSFGMIFNFIRLLANVKIFKFIGISLLTPLVISFFYWAWVVANATTEKKFELKD